jgi:hypothetical protein
MNYLGMVGHRLGIIYMQSGRVVGRAVDKAVDEAVIRVEWLA